MTFYAELASVLLIDGPGAGDIYQVSPQHLDRPLYVQPRPKPESAQVRPASEFGPAREQPVVYHTNRSRELLLLTRDRLIPASVDPKLTSAHMRETFTPLPGQMADQLGYVEAQFLAQYAAGIPGDYSAICRMLWTNTAEQTATVEFSALYSPQLADRPNP